MTTSEILLPDELDELRQGALLARVRLGLEANLSLPPSKLLAALDAYVSDYVSPPTGLPIVRTLNAMIQRSSYSSAAASGASNSRRRSVGNGAASTSAPGNPKPSPSRQPMQAWSCILSKPSFCTANASCRCASPAVWLSFQNRVECQCSRRAGSKTSWTTSNDGRLQSSQADTTLYDINNRCPTAVPTPFTTTRSSPS